MYYLLMDNHGTALDTFPDREEAMDAWDELVHNDRSAREEVAVLACDDEGVAIERIDPAREGQSITGGGAKSRTKGALEGAKEKLGIGGDDDEDEVSAAQRRQRAARSAARSRSRIDD